MLYIKFNIRNAQKYTDFQRVYEHMVMVRQPGFEFEEEEPEEIDWDKLSDEEMDQVISAFSEEEDLEIKRYKDLIPSYANSFFEKYFQVDNAKLGPLGILEVSSMLNYLEYGFEVDMDRLERLDEQTGMVEFSTGNYPYGGMERFLIALKAFELIPTECYNGFTVYQFDWTSDFEHEAIELPEKTKAYLKRFEN